MEFKDGIAWEQMHPAMWYARWAAEATHRELFGRGVTITSARRDGDGPSKHDFGRALDLRVWGLKKHDQREWARVLQERLGPDFFVLVEGPAAEIPKYKDRAPHVHVQWNGE